MPSVTCRDRGIHFTRCGLISLAIIFINSVTAAQSPLGEQLPKSVDSLSRLLQSYTPETPDSVRLEILLKLSDEYQEINVLTAQEYAIEAVALSRKTSNVGLKARALRYLAETKRIAGDFPTALEHSLAALKLVDSVASPNAKLSVLNTIANLHAHMEQYKESAAYDSMILDLAQQIDHKMAIMVAYSNLGHIAMNTGNYEQSIIFSNKALTMSRQLHHTNSEMIALNNIGDAYARMKQFNKALFYLKWAIETGTNAGDPSVPYTDLELARVYVHGVNRVEEGQAMALKVVDYAQEVGDGELLQAAYNLVSESYEKQLNMGAALEYYRKAQHKKDSLHSLQKDKLMESLKLDYESEAKDLQIRNLKQQEQLNAEGLRRKNAQVTFLTAGLLCFGIVVMMLLFLISYRKRKNNLLQGQKEQIERQANELSEKNETLQTLNEELATTMEELSQSNDNLSHLNTHLEEMVAERTMALTQQNQQLADYAFMVAHILRAPVARIQGLIYLLGHNNPNLSVDDKNMLQMLDTSADELDRATRKIQATLNEIGLEKK